MKLSLFGVQMMNPDTDDIAILAAASDERAIRDDMFPELQKEMAVLLSDRSISVVDRTKLIHAISSMKVVEMAVEIIG
ncbi:hypothetical protein LAV_00056 [Sphingobium phage Lacusarx]|uniref:Uncharacterized protein n=1 Tax=Sphingobium phage Lacusarx TaxID=1980139 RepID=A0A1W6DX70_9CAUD|nr:hypothetical protein FDH44_gp056 [Sphingobium phage Lacusarx]ARK07456.1 hypothetical protein LAV_00056 [Sphingobium phage Lacusarx]